MSAGPRRQRDDTLLQPAGQSASTRTERQTVRNECTETLNGEHRSAPIMQTSQNSLPGTAARLSAVSSHNRGTEYCTAGAHRSLERVFIYKRPSVTGGPEYQECSLQECNGERRRADLGIGRNEIFSQLSVTGLLCYRAFSSLLLYA